MGDMRRVYSEAADIAVTVGERLDLWTRFSFYEVRGEGAESEAVAPRNVSEELVRRSWRVKGRRVDVAEIEGVPFSDLRHVRWSVTYSPEGKRPRSSSTWAIPTCRWEDYPDLFDKFARLPDHGEIGTEVWLRWLHQYGVLGTLPGRPGSYQRNEVADSFSEFVQEALLKTGP